MGLKEKRVSGSVKSEVMRLVSAAYSMPGFLDTAWLNQIDVTCTLNLFNGGDIRGKPKDSGRVVEYVGIVEAHKKSLRGELMTNLDGLQVDEGLKENRVSKSRQFSF